MPLALPRDVASNACKTIKPITESAKLGDLSKFGSLGVSNVDTNSDCLEIPASRQTSQMTSSDAYSLEEHGMEMQKDEVMSIVQNVVKSSVHAVSLMDPTDPNGRLLAVSESLQVITGYNEAELLRAPPQLLTAGCEHETDPEMQAAIRNAHLGGSPLLARAACRHKQGWLFWSTMHIRGLMVAVDPVSEEPMWFVLTIYSSSEGPSDENEQESRDARRKLQVVRELWGASEELRAEIHDELARCADGAHLLAGSEADPSRGFAGVLWSRWAGLDLAGPGRALLVGVRGGRVAAHAAKGCFGGSDQCTVLKGSRWC